MFRTAPYELTACFSNMFQATHPNLLSLIPAKEKLDSETYNHPEILSWSSKGQLRELKSFCHGKGANAHLYLNNTCDSVTSKRRHIRRHIYRYRHIGLIVWIVLRVVVRLVGFASTLPHIKEELMWWNCYLATVHHLIVQLQ